jgi:hypothetical protein
MVCDERYLKRKHFTRVERVPETTFRIAIGRRHFEDEREQFQHLFLSQANYFTKFVQLLESFILVAQLVGDIVIIKHGLESDVFLTEQFGEVMG